ncbi:MAG: universal stress protein [Thermomicrobiales bacterium]
MNRSTTSEPSRILVPLDGSEFAEEALAYALALSSPNTHVLLLRVIAGERERSSPKHILGGSAIDELRRERQDALEYLVATASEVRHNGASVQPIASVAVGDTAEQIVRVARDRGYDMIVMSSHGRGAVRRLAYGSVADRVARTSPVPVLIVRPGSEGQKEETRQIRRLVVPLDGSPLAEKALPIAARLAPQIGVPMLIVSVVESWGAASPFMAYPAGLSTEYQDEAMASAETWLRKSLEKVGQLASAENLTVSTQILRGPIAPSIMAATRAGDLVVMTSHCRSGISRFLLGSVAEKLVRECQAPVLLVPPGPWLATAGAHVAALSVATTS